MHKAQEISSSKDEADALSGIATTYQLEQNFNKAREYFRQAHLLYHAMGCEADAARVLTALDSLD